MLGARARARGLAGLERREWRVTLPQPTRELASGWEAIGHVSSLWFALCLSFQAYGAKRRFTVKVSDGIFLDVCAMFWTFFDRTCLQSISLRT